MSILLRRTSEWALLILHLPEKSSLPIGVLLSDTTDQLYVRLREDLETLQLDEECAAVFAGLKEELRARGQDLGGTGVLEWLEDSASHVLQICERHAILVANPEQSLDDLYYEHVACVTVLPIDRNSRAVERYRVHAAVAAGIAVVALIAASLTRPSVPLRTSMLRNQVSSANPNLLIDWPQRPSMPVNVFPTLRSKGAYHRLRTRPIPHARKSFQYTEALIPKLAMRGPVQRAAPPALAETDFGSGPLIEVSLPEAPPFQIRRNRFVRFVCVLASSLKRFFSSSDGEASVLN